MKDSIKDQKLGKIKELYQTFSELLSIISNTSYLFFYFKTVRRPFQCLSIHNQDLWSTKMLIDL